MSTLKVTLDLPRDLIGALDVPQAGLAARLTQLVALELLREGRISSGKAAELLGISKSDLASLLAQRGIPYFTESPDELAADVAMLEQMLGQSIG
jgi:predicted HTH domain antitoxin